MNTLKQSTAVTVVVGPFVDATDGFTPETGLAAGTVDDIGVYKEGASSLTDISGTTTFTHVSEGFYTLTLSTTDTGTLGTLVVSVVDTSICRPYKERFTVLPANIYNSLVLGTDKLEIDLVQVAGTTQAVDVTSNMLKVDVASISGDSTAANNLESYCDGTTPIPSNATQISGDSTAADNLELDYDGTGYAKANSTIGVCSLVTALDTQAKSDVNAEVDSALNTAIPASPTADSINQRVKAIDVLTEASGDGDLAAILLDTGTDGVKIDMAQAYPTTVTNGTTGDALATARSVRNNIAISGTTLTVKKDDGSTTFYTKTLDSATNPTSLT